MPSPGASRWHLRPSASSPSRSIRALSIASVSAYNYAHMPQMFRIQRQIPDASLPAAETKLTLLAEAADNGTLHRNFQGYATRPDLDLIGLGASSIGQIGDSFNQNVRDPAGHAAAVDAGELPIWRGVELTADDRL